MCPFSHQNMALLAEQAVRAVRQAHGEGHMRMNQCILIVRGVDRGRKKGHWNTLEAICSDMFLWWVKPMVMSQFIEHHWSWPVHMVRGLSVVGVRSWIFVHWFTFHLTYVHKINIKFIIERNKLYSSLYWEDLCSTNRYDYINTVEETETSISLWSCNRKT